MSKDTNTSASEILNYELTEQAAQAVAAAAELVTLMKRTQINSQDLLLAMVMTMDTGAGYALGKYSITRTKIANEIDNADIVEERIVFTYTDDDDDDSNIYSLQSRERHLKEYRAKWILENPVEFIEEEEADVALKGLENFSLSENVEEILAFAEDFRYQNAPDQGIDTYWILLGMIENKASNAFALIEKLILQTGSAYEYEMPVHKRFPSDRYASKENRDGRVAEKLSLEAEEAARVQRRMVAPEDKLPDPVIDLVEEARQGFLTELIGREKEIRNIELGLVRHDRSNLVLIGESGVGKTAIVEGLAKRIADGKSKALKNKRLLRFNMKDFYTISSLDRKLFMKKMLSQLAEDKDSILFIDDIHHIIDERSELFETALADGQLRVIGTVRPRSWERAGFGAASVKNFFELLLIDEPSIKEAEEIIASRLPLYEHHYQLHYDRSASSAAVRLARQYMTQIKLPASALSLIDNAGAIVSIESGGIAQADRPYEDKLKELKHSLENLKAEEFPDMTAIEETEKAIEQATAELRQAQKRSAMAKAAYALTVTEETVKQAVELKTGIPVKDLSVSKDDTYMLEKLQTLSERLSEKVIGQTEAIDVVSKAVIRSKTGFRDPNRPIGVYLFLGTTGVGKTETAKTLAEELFGDPKTMVRFDMSEYQQEHTVAKLIGAPPGYVGFNDGGQLTNQIKRNPYSVILFDEVEKAHPRVFDILLQVFDDGILTDGNGITVDFRNTIIILTSNLGAKEIRQEKVIGFGQRISELDYKYVHDSVHQAVKDYFRPEFLNRIDETVIFKPFDDETLLKITRLLVDKEKKLIALQGIEADFDDRAIAFIAQTCSDPVNGARPLKRGITRLIEDKLSNLLIHREIKKGDRILVTEKDEQIEIVKQET